MTTRIEKKFEELREKGKTALITYFTAGDPSRELTAEIALTLEKSGADIIELGVPFSDPMADGPTIQLASERSLENGTTLGDSINIVAEIRKKSEIPILLFGYYNPFFSYGHQKFAEDAKAAGVDGVLIVDLPPEEAGDLKEQTDKCGLDFVFLLAPTSTGDRISLVSEYSSGFVYLVSVTGVTGARATMDYSIEKLVKAIKANTDLPVGVGFGVSTPEQVREISKFADAVIVGSALVKIIEKDGSDRAALLKDIEKFVKGLSEACYKG